MMDTWKSNKSTYRGTKRNKKGRATCKTKTKCRRKDAPSTNTQQHKPSNNIVSQIHNDIPLLKGSRTPCSTVSASRTLSSFSSSFAATSLLHCPSSILTDLANVTEFAKVSKPLSKPFNFDANELPNKKQSESLPNTEAKPIELPIIQPSPTMTRIYYNDQNVVTISKFDESKNPDGSLKLYQSIKASIGKLTLPHLYVLKGHMEQHTQGSHTISSQVGKLVESTFYGDNSVFVNLVNLEKPEECGQFMKGYPRRLEIKLYENKRHSYMINERENMHIKWNEFLSKNYVSDANGADYPISFAYLEKGLIHEVILEPTLNQDYQDSQVQQDVIHNIEDNGTHSNDENPQLKRKNKKKKEKHSEEVDASDPNSMFLVPPDFIENLSDSDDDTFKKKVFVEEAVPECQKLLLPTNTPQAHYQTFDHLYDDLNGLVGPEVGVPERQYNQPSVLGPSLKSSIHNTTCRPLSSLSSLELFSVYSSGTTSDLISSSQTLKSEPNAICPIFKTEKGEDYQKDKVSPELFQVQEADGLEEARSKQVVTEDVGPIACQTHNEMGACEISELKTNLQGFTGELDIEAFEFDSSTSQLSITGSFQTSSKRLKEREKQVFENSDNEDAETEGLEVEMSDEYDAYGDDSLRTIEILVGELASQIPSEEEEEEEEEESQGTSDNLVETDKTSHVGYNSELKPGMDKLTRALKKLKLSEVSSCSASLNRLHGCQIFPGKQSSASHLKLASIEPQMSTGLTQPLDSHAIVTGDTHFTTVQVEQYSNFADQAQITQTKHIERIYNAEQITTRHEQPQSEASEFAGWPALSALSIPSSSDSSDGFYFPPHSGDLDDMGCTSDDLGSAQYSSCCETSGNLSQSNSGFCNGSCCNSGNLNRAPLGINAFGITSAGLLGPSFAASLSSSLKIVDPNSAGTNTGIGVPSGGLDKLNGNKFGAFRNRLLHPLSSFGGFRNLAVFSPHIGSLSTALSGQLVAHSAEVFNTCNATVENDFHAEMTNEEKGITAQLEESRTTISEPLTIEEDEIESCANENQSSVRTLTGTFEEHPNCKSQSHTRCRCDKHLSINNKSKCKKHQLKNTSNCRKSKRKGKRKDKSNLPGAEDFEPDFFLCPATPDPNEEDGSGVAAGQFYLGNEVSSSLITAIIQCRSPNPSLRSKGDRSHRSKNYGSIGSFTSMKGYEKASLTSYAEFFQEPSVYENLMLCWDTGTGVGKYSGTHLVYHHAVKVPNYENLTEIMPLGSTGVRRKHNLNNYYCEDELVTSEKLVVGSFRNKYDCNAKLSNLKDDKKKPFSDPLLEFLAGSMSLSQNAYDEFLETHCTAFGPLSHFSSLKKLDSVTFSNNSKVENLNEQRSEITIVEPVTDNLLADGLIDDTHEEIKLEGGKNWGQSYEDVKGQYFCDGYDGAHPFYGTASDDEGYASLDDEDTMTMRFLDSLGMGFEIGSQVGNEADNLEIPSLFDNNESHNEVNEIGNIPSDEMSVELSRDLQILDSLNIYSDPSDVEYVDDLFDYTDDLSYYFESDEEESDNQENIGPKSPILCEIDNTFEKKVCGVLTDASDLTTDTVLFSMHNTASNTDKEVTTISELDDSEVDTVLIVEQITLDAEKIPSNNSLKSILKEPTVRFTRTYKPVKHVTQRFGDNAQASIGSDANLPLQELDNSVHFASPVIVEINSYTPEYTACIKSGETELKEFLAKFPVYMFGTFPSSPENDFSTNISSQLELSDCRATNLEYHDEPLKNINIEIGNDSELVTSENEIILATSCSLVSPGLLTIPPSPFQIDSSEICRANTLDMCVESPLYQLSKLVKSITEELTEDTIFCGRLLLDGYDEKACELANDTSSLSLEANMDILFEGPYNYVEHKMNSNSEDCMNNNSSGMLELTKYENPYSCCDYTTLFDEKSRGNLHSPSVFNVESISSPFDEENFISQSTLQRYTRVMDSLSRLSLKGSKKQEINDQTHLSNENYIYSKVSHISTDIESIQNCARLEETDNVQSKIESGAFDSTDNLLYEDTFKGNLSNLIPEKEGMGNRDKGTSRRFKSFFNPLSSSRRSSEASLSSSLSAFDFEYDFSKPLYQYNIYSSLKSRAPDSPGIAASILPNDVFPLHTVGTLDLEEDCSFDGTFRKIST